jgi:hypothetical protein
MKVRSKGVYMSEKNQEMMKKILEQKKATQSNKQKMIPNKKIGSSQKGKLNQKAGGSNNKV